MAGSNSENVPPAGPTKIGGRTRYGGSSSVVESEWSRDSELLQFLDFPATIRALIQYPSESQ